MSNTNAVEKRPSFTMVINSDGYKNMINRTLGDPKRAARFIASITSAVITTPTLQTCTPQSIVSGGLLGEALGLSPSPQLGHYYLVPYKDNKAGTTTATFQMGYRGYVQLALRSGYYKRINVIEVKQGELVKYDPFTEEFEAVYMTDETARAKAPTVGYYAFFEYLNGFRKILYWTKEKMEHHAITYSPGYRAKKGYTFWEKDFDEMAKKTMLRQLISKWGIMSIEMQEAFEKDNNFITDDGTFTPTEISIPTVDNTEGKEHIEEKDKPKKDDTAMSLDEA